MKGFGRRLLPYLTTLAVTALLIGLMPVSDTLWARVLTFSGSVETREQEAEGCSLGFWKQEQHFKFWPDGYDPGDSFEAIFQRDVPSDPNLLEALELGGGGLNALMRQATAALLNAASETIDFPYTAEQVIEMFQAAYESGDPEPTKDAFDAANNGVCPLPSRQATAKLGAEVTAEGSHEEELAFDWSVTVSLDPASLELEQGEGGSLIAQLGVTRAPASKVDRFGASGEVCVTNEGGEATQQLSIEVIVQARLGDGDFKDLASTAVDTSSRPSLAAGERHCYAYQVAFVPEEGAEYRVAGRVTAANEAERTEASAGPVLVASGFLLPAAPSLTEIDGEANMSGSFECPGGFECIASGAEAWHLTDSGIIEYELVVLNVSAACEDHPLAITTTLLEAQSGQERPSVASAAISAIGCEAEESGPSGPEPAAWPTPTNTATPEPTDPPTTLPTDPPEPSLTPSEPAAPTEESTPTPPA